MGAAHRGAAKLGGRLQVRAFGHDAVFDEAPQGNHQFARHGHDADAPAAAAGRRKAVSEPLAQRTVRLPAQPAPGHLNTDPPQLAATRFANPLVLHALVVSSMSFG